MQSSEIELELHSGSIFQRMFYDTDHGRGLVEDVNGQYQIFCGLRNSDTSKDGNSVDNESASEVVVR